MQDKFSFFSNCFNRDKGENIIISSSALLMGLSEEQLRNPKATIIALRNWIEDLDDSHRGHIYGWQLGDLPPAARGSFKALFPNQKDDADIEFWQIKEWMQERRKVLKKMHDDGHINFIDLASEGTTEEVIKEGKLELKVDNGILRVMFGNEEKHSVPVENVNMVVNGLSVPRNLRDKKSESSGAEVAGGKLMGVEPKRHVELYAKNKKEAPARIFVYGGGLSTVWLKKHFPDSDIIAVVSDPKTHKWIQIPLNKDVDCSKIKMVGLDDIGVYPEDDTKFLVKVGYECYIIPKDDLYMAIGFDLCEHLTKELEELGNIKVVTFKDADKGQLTAPKNIAKGSLVQRNAGYNKFFSKGISSLQVYMDNAAPQHVMEELLDKGVKLKPEFAKDFANEVRERIMENDNLVSQADEHEIYMKAYKKCGGPQNGEKALDEILKGLQARFNRECDDGEKLAKGSENQERSSNIMSCSFL